MSLPSQGHGEHGVIGGVQFLSRSDDRSREADGAGLGFASQGKDNHAEVEEQPHPRLPEQHSCNHWVNLPQNEP
jgi:hypothetical protein